MRFGLFVPQGWRLDLVGIEPDRQWPTMLEVARAADSGPWESIWVYDHFHTVPVPTEEATHEAWTSWPRSRPRTRRIRLGQMCTCMAYRNPAYLAKVAATVDVISGGRVEMGIGGGWYRARMARLRLRLPAAPASGCAHARRGRADHAPDSGRRARQRSTASTTRSTARSCRPLPLQHGGIPFWIAGGGEKQHPAHRRSVRRLHQLRRHPRRLSRASRRFSPGTAATSALDFDAITRSANFNVVIGETAKDVAGQAGVDPCHFEPFVPADRVEPPWPSRRRGSVGRHAGADH